MRDVKEKKKQKTFLTNIQNSSPTGNIWLSFYNPRGGRKALFSKKSHSKIMIGREWQIFYCQYTNIIVYLLAASGLKCHQTEGYMWLFMVCGGVSSKCYPSTQWS